MIIEIRNKSQYFSIEERWERAWRWRYRGLVGLMRWFGIGLFWLGLAMVDQQKNEENKCAKEKRDFSNL